MNLRLAQYYLAILFLFLNAGFPLSRQLGDSSGNDFLDIVIRGSDISLFLLTGWLGITALLVVYFPMGSFWAWMRSLNIFYAWFRAKDQLFMKSVVCLLPFFAFDHLLLSFSLPIVVLILLTRGYNKSGLTVWYWLNALIALFQIISQKSLGLWFLGESYIETGLTGIARLEVFSQTVLRGYGLTPHPNILALVGVLGILFLPKKWYNTVPAYAVVLFSFSRAGLLSVALLGAMHIYEHKSVYLTSIKQRVLASLLSVVTLISLIPLLIRSSDTYRVDNIRQWWASFTQSSIDQQLFGIGLGQYSFHLREQFPSLEIWQYQPVHSIPLMLLSELGLTLTLIFAILIVVITYKTKTKHFDDTKDQISLQQ